jgi:predicted nucleic acid-binding protein
MASRKPRPFIDTNVLFSGLYSPLGPSAAILRQHAQGDITIVISHQVLEELVGVIKNKKPDLLPLLHILLTHAPPELCADPTIDEVEEAKRWINPTDAPILAAARTSDADCIVTGNTRHFTPTVARRAAIKIFTPAQYVEEFGARR